LTGEGCEGENAFQCVVYTTSWANAVPSGASIVRKPPPST